MSANTWKVKVHLQDGRSATILVEASSMKDAEDVILALCENTVRYIEARR